MPLLETDPVDWELDADDDLVIPMRYTRGLPAVAQGSKIRARLILGELFCNVGEGVAYLERPGVPAERAILGQKFNQIQAAADFRRAIGRTPGVTTVPSLTVERDSATRAMFVRWRSKTVWGDTLPDTLTVDS